MGDSGPVHSLRNIMKCVIGVLIAASLCLARPEADAVSDAEADAYQLFSDILSDSNTQDDSTITDVFKALAGKTIKAVSGSITGGSPTSAGQMSGSYEINTNNGNVGAGTYSYNLKDSTVSGLTFNGHTIFETTSAVVGQRSFGPGGDRPWTINWTAQPSRQIGGVSGTFGVSKQDGSVHYGTFDFNFLDGSVPKITYKNF